MTEIEKVFVPELERVSEMFGAPLILTFLAELVGVDQYRGQIWTIREREQDRRNAKQRARYTLPRATAPFSHFVRLTEPAPQSSVLPMVRARGK